MRYEVDYGKFCCRHKHLWAWYKQTARNGCSHFAQTKHNGYESDDCAENGPKIVSVRVHIRVFDDRPGPLAKLAGFGGLGARLLPFFPLQPGWDFRVKRGQLRDFVQLPAHHIHSINLRVIIHSFNERDLQHVVESRSFVDDHQFAVTDGERDMLVVRPPHPDLIEDIQIHHNQMLVVQNHVENLLPRCREINLAEFHDQHVIPICRNTDFVREGSRVISLGLIQYRVVRRDLYRWTRIYRSRWEFRSGEDPPCSECPARLCVARRPR